MDLRKIRIGAQEFHEIGSHALAPPGLLHQLAAVQGIKLEAEVHELLEQLQRLIAQGAALVEDAQRVHDERRVPVPVKEIVRVRIVGSQNRGGHDRAHMRLHALAESRALLDDVDGRNAAQHLVGAVVVLGLDPGVQG